MKVSCSSPQLYVIMQDMAYLSCNPMENHHEIRYCPAHRLCICQDHNSTVATGIATSCLQHRDRVQITCKSPRSVMLPEPSIPAAAAAASLTFRLLSLSFFALPCSSTSACMHRISLGTLKCAHRYRWGYLQIYMYRWGHLQICMFG